jgi:hypothetical protein
MVVNTNLNKDSQAEEKAPDQNAEIASIIKETRDMAKQTLKMTKKIKSYIFLQQVFTFLKLFLILIPIIAAWVYLPRLIEDFKANPQALMESSFLAPYIEGIVGTAASKLDPTSIDLNKIDIDKLPPEYRNLLKK